MTSRDNARGYSALTWISVLLALIGLLYLARGLFHPPPPPPQLSQNITLLPQPKPLRDFQLTDHNGQPFNLARLHGRWNLVFFGYTHCPDICPTTLIDLRQTLKLLADSADRMEPPQVVFVTLDPARDSIPQLRDYVSYFHPDFIGVTGPQAQIDGLALQVHALAVRVPDPHNPDNYLVDHTAGILLIDPRGRWRAMFSPPHTPAILAEDYLKLAHYDEETQ